MTRKNIFLLALLFGAAPFCLALTHTAWAAPDVPQFPPPKALGPVETYGRNIQRTMTLLAVCAVHIQSSASASRLRQCQPERFLRRVMCMDVAFEF